MTKVRNTLLLVLTVIVGLALYDASSGDGGKLKDKMNEDERKVEIRFFAAPESRRVTFNVEGRFGNTPFREAGKRNLYVKHGTARVGDEAYASMFLQSESARGLVSCQVWQGGRDITESTAGPDQMRDFTCWAQVKA